MRAARRYIASVLIRARGMSIPAFMVLVDYGPWPAGVWLRADTGARSTRKQCAVGRGESWLRQREQRPGWPSAMLVVLCDACWPLRAQATGPQYRRYMNLRLPTPCRHPAMPVPVPGHWPVSVPARWGDRPRKPCTDDHRPISTLRYPLLLAGCLAPGQG